VIIGHDLGRRPEPQRSRHLLCGFLDLSLGEVHLRQIQVSIVLAGLQDLGGPKVDGGSLQLLPIEMVDPTGKVENIPSILIRIELERLLKVGFCLRQCVLLFVGKAPEEVGPNELVSLAEAGVQARLGRFPVMPLQVRDSKEETGPEMDRLQGEGAVEGDHGLLPVTAPV
jgi:hypothetical protein